MPVNRNEACFVAAIHATTYSITSKGSVRAEEDGTKCREIQIRADKHVHPEEPSKAKELEGSSVGEMRSKGLMRKVESRGVDWPSIQGDGVREWSGGG